MTNAVNGIEQGIHFRSHMKTEALECGTARKSMMLPISIRHRVQFEK